MFTDIDESALASYKSDQLDPHDFDSFWELTLGDTREHPLNLTLAKVPTPLKFLDVYDVTFNGFAGHPVKAWLRLPKERAEPTPLVVEYVGYGGGRGVPHENLLISSAGLAHLVMDSRGQGSSWSLGATSDNFGSGPQVPGVMTKGIQDKSTYYYRRLITDAVRAIDAARSIDFLESPTVGLMGVSQGGGIALAASALSDAVTAVVARVPFLCDFRRATTITDELPYKEIGKYLSSRRTEFALVHETLAYFDGVNFAKRAHAPAHFTAALMDAVCPPSTVFGAYNNYAGPKEIRIWPYNGHEGGQFEDDAESLEFLVSHLSEGG